MAVFIFCKRDFYELLPVMSVKFLKCVLVCFSESRWVTATVEWLSLTVSSEKINKCPWFCRAAPSPLFSLSLFTWTPCIVSDLVHLSDEVQPSRGVNSFCSAADTSKTPQPSSRHGERFRPCVESPVSSWGVAARNSSLADGFRERLWNPPPPPSVWQGAEVIYLL